MEIARATNLLVLFGIFPQRSALLLERCGVPLLSRRRLVLPMGHQMIVVVDLLFELSAQLAQRR